MTNYPINLVGMKVTHLVLVKYADLGNNFLKNTISGHQHLFACTSSDDSGPQGY